MKNNYNDIINLPHHISNKHKPMPLEARAAQFAPFSALTGYENEISKTETLVEMQVELENTNMKVDE